MHTKGRGSQGYENLVRTKYSGFTVVIYEISIQRVSKCNWNPWAYFCIMLSKNPPDEAKNQPREMSRGTKKKKKNDISLRVPVCLLRVGCTTSKTFFIVVIRWSLFISASDEFKLKQQKKSHKSPQVAWTLIYHRHPIPSFDRNRASLTTFFQKKKDRTQNAAIPGEASH